MSFHLGQRVVCIDERFSPDPYWRSTVRTFPRRRCVYTIRDMREQDDLIGLCLHEIHNPPAAFERGTFEPAFNSQNFRPVRDTSIEIFERMLAGRELVTTE